MESRRIVVIRIAGRTGIKKQIKDTLNMLRLYKKHNCILVPNAQPYLGMIAKVKDNVTWGEIDEKTCLELFQKRAKLAKKTSLTDDYLKQKVKMDIPTFTKEFITFKKELKDVPGLKLFFKLSPPEGGFERKGIKQPFSMGGVLGYRKEKINELLMRMI
jgi:large subunit ribosomal protein L30